VGSRSATPATQRTRRTPARPSSGDRGGVLHHCRPRRQHWAKRSSVMSDLAEIAADRVRVTDEEKARGLWGRLRGVEARTTVRVEHTQVADHRFQARGVAGRGDDGVRLQPARAADHLTAFENRDPKHDLDAPRLELGQETDIDEGDVSIDHASGYSAAADASAIPQEAS